MCVQVRIIRMMYVCVSCVVKYTVKYTRKVYRRRDLSEKLKNESRLELEEVVCRVTHGHTSMTQYVLYADHLSVRSAFARQFALWACTAHRGPRSRVSSNGAMHRR